MDTESAKSEASGSSHESASPPRPARGRGRPRRARGRGMRGRGRGRGTRSPMPPGEESSASQSTSVESRRRHMEILVNELTLDQARQILGKVTEKVPSLVFDILEETERGNVGEPGDTQQVTGTPGPTAAAIPPWCTCTRCEEMPTDQERICCGRNRANCMSLLPHFELLCLDETVLAVARLQRQDLLALDQEVDQHKQSRHTAYRQFIYWQHGRLGEGRRRVIPSCCVWAIRRRFPDANNFYVGFRPGRFGI